MQPCKLCRWGNETAIEQSRGRTVEPPLGSWGLGGGYVAAIQAANAVPAAGMGGERSGHLADSSTAVVASKRRRRANRGAPSHSNRCRWVPQHPTGAVLLWANGALGRFPESGTNCAAMTPTHASPFEAGGSPQQHQGRWRCWRCRRRCQRRVWRGYRSASWPLSYSRRRAGSRSTSYATWQPGRGGGGGGALDGPRGADPGFLCGSGGLDETP